MKKLLVPVVSLLLFIIALLMSKDYPQGAKLYPLVIIACGIVFTSAVLIQEMKNILREKKKPGQFRISFDTISIDPFLVKQLFVVISTVIYTILVYEGGFILVSTFYTFLNFYILGFRRKFVVLLLSVAFPLFLYIVFGVMIKIALPRVFLEDWISEIVR